MRKTPSTLLAHKAGYIDRDNEVIVGLQTDQPFKRAIFPYGGLRMVEAGLKAAGFEPDPAVHEAFTKYRKSHNDGVFDAYTPEIMNCRRSGIITGLPDAYGRGRIIGDYRRVALYGVDRLLEAKRAERAQIDDMWPTDEIIRVREELSEQMRALEDLASMAKLYDYDISKPASECPGSVPVDLFRLSRRDQGGQRRGDVDRPHLDLPRHLHRARPEGRRSGRGRAQELWDQLVQKLRIVRFLRTPDYDALFSGDPYWATECVGGMDLDGRALVTKSSYRMLHTLYNLGPAPEPNITVLWSNHMPAPFKRYCVKVSSDTSSLQYENDDLMRPFWGDDYGIACCVSAMRLGKQMQFFGARVNLAKALLYAINGGRDEVSGDQVAPPDIAGVRRLPRLRRRHGQVRHHDGMAGPHLRACDELHPLHARQVLLRTPGDGASRSRHSANDGVRHRRPFGGRRQPERDQVRKDARHARRDRTGRRLSERRQQIHAAVRQQRRSRRPDRVRASSPASWRRSASTRPIETRRTRRACSPSPRTSCTARPPETPRTDAARASRSGREPTRCTAATAMAGSRPACRSQSFPTRMRRTASATPSPSRRRRRICREGQLVDEAVKAFDVYFERGGFHMNLNVIDKETLEDAMKNPDKYPQLTIRVSGYAVNFVRLTPEQQRDVISRTFHGQI